MRLALVCSGFICLVQTVVFSPISQRVVIYALTLLVGEHVHDGRRQQADESNHFERTFLAGKKKMFVKHLKELATRDTPIR